MGPPRGGAQLWGGPARPLAVLLLQGLPGELAGGRRVHGVGVPVGRTRGYTAAPRCPCWGRGQRLKLSSHIPGLTHAILPSCSLYVLRAPHSCLPGLAAPRRALGRGCFRRSRGETQPGGRRLVRVGHSLGPSLHCEDV